MPMREDLDVVMRMGLYRMHQRGLFPGFYRCCPIIGIGGREEFAV